MLDAFKLTAILISGVLWGAWLVLVLRKKDVHPLRDALGVFCRLGWMKKVGVLFVVVQLTMFGGAKHGGTNDGDDVTSTNDVELVECGTNDWTKGEGGTNGWEIVEGGTNDLDDVDFGGTNGGSYAFTLTDDGKLQRLGGSYVPRNGTVSAGEGFLVKVKYDAVSASGSEGDIKSKVEFTENGTGRKLSNEAELTAVKVELTTRSLFVSGRS